MSSNWTKELSAWCQKKRWSKPIFDKRKQKPAVVPKKGMLVRKKEYYIYSDLLRLLDSEDTGSGPFFCIIDSIVDERGRCIFKYISSEEIQWTEWMTVKEFNEEWYIQNPWI